MRCFHCGHEGEDVHIYPCYEGGEGRCERPMCDDLVACWLRWDEQHGLVERELVESPAG